MGLNLYTSSTDIQLVRIMQELLVRRDVKTSIAFEEEFESLKGNTGEKELKERLLEALVAKKLYSQELQNLQMENAQLKSMPLSIASVVEKMDDKTVL